MLFAADVLVFLLAVAAATLVEGTTDPLWSLWLAPLWALVAKLEGLYDADHPRIWHRTSDEASKIFHWVTVSSAATLFVLRGLPEQTIRLESALTLYFVALGAAFPMRAAARALWRRLVAPERTLVIGDGELARSVGRKLTLEPHHNVEVIGRVRRVANDAALIAIRDDAAATSRTAVALGATRNGRHAGPPADRDPLWGSVLLDDLSVDDLRQLIRHFELERIVLAAPELDEQTLARVLAACRQSGCKLSVVPPMPAMLGTAVELTHIAELPLIEYATWPTPPSTIALKRAIDVIIGGLLLVLVAPLMALIALAIRLDSRGPVLFRQPRAGKDGKPFTMLKFRTMCVDAERRLCEFLNVDELEEPVFKIPNDPRVTRVGRILRRLSLDELPQLINVVRGEMSLVGPRPEETWLVDRYAEHERFRLLMRPGLTGPMQVHGRGDLSFQERLAVEREYVENYTLRKDFQILLRTFSAIVRGGGAY